MIYFPEKKKVIITPPHTASGNLHRSLCKEAYGGQWVLGPNPGGLIDHHWTKVHRTWSDCEIALVVRNPLARFAAIWEHMYYFKKIPWAVFLEKHRRNEMDCFCTYTISDWVRGQRVDTLIRFENLQESIDSFMGQSVKIEGFVHPGRNLKDLYRYEELRYVIKWAREDCDKYGYKMPTLL